MFSFGARLPRPIRIPGKARTIGGVPQSIFPLSVHASGKYLVDGQGSPFMMAGDTPWSIIVQLTNAQITSYLDDRQSKGCNAILFNAIERGYSSQSPVYNNVDGQAPFTTMTPDVSWTSRNDTYWQRVDFVVNEAKARDMVCLICPAYTGYGSGTDGWLNQYGGASDADLQNYGAFLANRFTQGNVIWVLGGDDANDAEAAGNYGSGTTPQRTKQWQIALGIRSVRTTDLISGHTARNGTGVVSGEAYKAWTTGYTGFNLNNVYGHDDPDDMPTLMATAVTRTGFPCFMIEAGYENTDGADNAAWSAAQAILSGCLGGALHGHDALWHFGSYAPNNTGVASVLSSYLSSSWVSAQNLYAMLLSFQWWKLEPKTDNSLITTAKGTGISSICPALASDGSFAMVWTPNVAITVVMSALTPSSVRARWFNYGDGSYTAIGTYSNTGTQVFTPSANRILVLDAAP